MQRRAVSQLAQRLTHVRKNQLRLIAQGKKSFSAAQLFAVTRYSQDFVRGHRVRTGLAGIATECAVATIVAAEIRQRNKNLARVGDYARLKYTTHLADTDPQYG